MKFSLRVNLFLTFAVFGFFSEGVVVLDKPIALDLFFISY